MNALLGLLCFGGGAAASTAVFLVLKLLGPKAIDHFFAKRLEVFRQSLVREADLLRHDLQREMLKAQLGTGKAYATAPKLLGHVRQAFSSVSAPLGLTFSPDWTKYRAEDLEHALRDRRLFPFPLLATDERQLLELIVHDPKEAARRLQTIETQQMLGMARRHCAQAQNFALLRGLFVPADVKEKALELIKRLRIALVDVESLRLDGRSAGVDHRKLRGDLDAIGHELDRLEKRVREVLSPVGGTSAVAEAIAASVQSRGAAITAGDRPVPASS